MRNSDNEYVYIVNSIDDLKRKTSHQKVAVALVTQWKPCGIGRNLHDRTIELSVEIIGGVNTALCVPA